MSRLTTPAGLHEITPTWLTAALKHGGSLSDASVTSYSVEKVNEGKGFMNEIVRLKLDYDDEPGNLPPSIIIKLPSTDPALKALEEKERTCQREIRFYTDIAPDAGLGTPYCYFGDIDPATGHAILLLEDMGDARHGDSVAGCSLDDAENALRQIAEFHANWWNNPGLDGYSWLPLKDVETSLYQELYPKTWELLLGQVGSRMPKELRSVGDRLCPAIPAIKAQLSSPPLTMTHGDYRLDNCFLGTAANPRSLVVFDWQYCARGRGTLDAASFILEAYPPQDRRREEMNLLKVYHSHLTKNRIYDYTFEDCLRDYKLSILDVFLFWVVVGGYCDFSGDRASVFLHNTMQRFDAAIADLDCIALLSD